MRSTSLASAARFFQITLPDADPAAQSMQLALVTLRTVCVLGLLAGVSWWWLLGPEAIRLNPVFITIYLTATEDTPWLLLCALLIPPLVLLAENARVARGLDAVTAWAAGLRRPVTLIAVLTLLLAATGARLVYHSFPLSLDEFLPWFEARTLLGGHILAPIAPGWDAFVEALQPIFMRYDHVHGLWVPGYRPLGAAIIALFELGGAGVYANSALAAGSVILVALVARRLWPQHRHAPALAALFLALSPQFLVTGMTSYAMTSHLFFNLLWLLLFLRDDKAGHIGAALTGFIAIGLHQVHIHPFFILPFMLHLLKERRVKLLLAYGVWYAAVLLFWVVWRDVATAMTATGTAGPAAVQSTEGLFFVERVLRLLQQHHLVDDTAFWTINIARFVGWQAPAVLLAAYLGLNSLSDAPPAVRLLAWGLLTTLLPYLAFMPGQGHGWGYRYLHVALGSIAIIAVHGVISLAAGTSGMPPNSRRILTAFVIIGLVIGIPLRLIQVESFVRPFARSSAYISQLPADTVIINTRDIWFGVDLVRNDPYLQNTPKILASSSLTTDKLRLLCARATPTLVEYDNVSHFGMRTYYDSVEAQKILREKFEQQLQDAGCAYKRPQ